MKQLFVTYVVCDDFHNAKQMFHYYPASLPLMYLVVNQSMFDLRVISF